jgi:hypothetical protein
MTSRHAFRIRYLILLFLIAMTATPPAAAKLVLWTLNDLKFADGQTAATGSFTFDTSTNSFSSSNITVYYDALLDSQFGSFGKVGQYTYGAPQTQASLLTGDNGVAFRALVYDEPYFSWTAFPILTALWGLDLEISGAVFLAQEGVTATLGVRTQETYYREIRDEFDNLLFNEVTAARVTGSMTSSAQTVPEPPLIAVLLIALSVCVGFTKGQRRCRPSPV